MAAVTTLRPARLVRAAALAALLAAAAGCDLFKPEDPEPPGGSGSNFEADYSTADRTLETLRLAVGTKVESEAYLGGFSDPADGTAAVFGFDPAVLQSMGRTAPDWTLADEARFFEHLAGRSPDAYSMTWSVLYGGGQDDEDLGAGTAVRHRAYEVFTQNLVVAKGQAELHFQRTTAGDWVVIRWVDSIEPGSDPANTTQPSFSRLRLES